MRMKSPKLRMSCTALAILSLVLANPGAAKPQDDDEEEIPFEEAELFFELNDTDGDLGIHGLADGDAWKLLQIEDLSERVLFKISARGSLRMQGLTELFFESAEPRFDELPPAEFFLRFPEGEYEIEGMTLDGAELESTVLLTHIMPAPPGNVTVSGQPAAENCDADPLPSAGDPVLIAWDPVTESHPEIGRPGEPIVVEQYEFFVEAEDLELGHTLPDDVTEFEVPTGILEPGETVTFEIIVREAGSGNQTAVESCFIVE